MSRQETAPTVHGEVDYKTVTCDSCGNEVAKQNASQFYIGSVKEVDDWTYRSAKEVEFDLYDYDAGWACDFCRPDPASYPQGKVFNYVASTRLIATLLLILAIVWVVL